MLRVIRELGADVVNVTPEHHDELVALVSHVPQLAASTLMDVATANEDDRRTMLRLAAGGFRDMTRIAAGHPGIWPDILTTNRDAVLAALDTYVAALLRAREIVASGAREDLLSLLERARSARRNLPLGVSMATKLVELRVPVPDRPGVIAEVTTLAGRLGVNVADVEIAHSLEGGRGVIVLVVAAIDADAYEAACTISDTTCPGPSWREPADRARLRRRACAARPAPAARRQVDLAPRAALRRARDRAQLDHEPRDRRRRARDARALEALGVGIRTGAEAVTVSGTGLDGWREPEAVLDCGNSGTTMRVLAGALAGRPFLSVLTGDASLRQRPMRRVTEPLRAMGAHVDGRADGAFAPLVIRGARCTACATSWRLRARR